MRKYSAFVICSVLLVGCAKQQVWEKATAGPGDFERERYACMQQSQQPSSDAYVGRYGGWATSGIITNNNLFSACMNSRGWNLSSKTAEGSTPYRDAIAAAVAEQNELCTREDFQAIYKKTPCTATQPDLEQLADRSKISSAEKIVLRKWRTALTEANKKIAAVHRQYNPQTGNQIAELIDKGLMESEAIALELYNGHISWGEFNKRRRDLNLKSIESYKSLGRGA